MWVSAYRYFLKGDSFMKAITAFLFLVILSFGAHAADRPDRKLAIEYLKVSRIEQIINSSLDTYSQQIFKNTPEADRAQLDKMMREVIGWEATKDQLADIVSDIYTKAELKASIAFMKTPLGASATAKGDAFSAQFAALLSQNLLKFIREHPVQPNPAVNSNAAQ
jgi:hypothetical protein